MTCGATSPPSCPGTRRWTARRSRYRPPAVAAAWSAPGSPRSTTGSGSRAGRSSPSVPQRGCPLAVPDHAGELGPAADAKLAEDLAQMVIHGAGADEQPGGDLPVGQVLGDQPGDLLLLRGEHLHGPGAARAGPLSGGMQLARGSFGECVGSHGRKHLVREAQLLAGVKAPACAAQPLAVEQMGAPEFHADASAAKAADRLKVESLGVLTFGDQCSRAGLDAERPVSATGTGGCREPLEGPGRPLGCPASCRRLDELG